MNTNFLTILTESLASFMRFQSLQSSGKPGAKLSHLVSEHDCRRIAYLILEWLNKRESSGWPNEPDKHVFQEAINIIEKHEKLLPAHLHIRYSAKTTALFSNLAEPCQHAVDNEILKTLCGRDASEYFKLDDLTAARHVNCRKCRSALSKIEGEKP